MRRDAVAGVLVECGFEAQPHFLGVALEALCDQDREGADPGWREGLWREAVHGCWREIVPLLFDAWGTPFFDEARHWARRRAEVAAEGNRILDALEADDGDYAVARVGGHGA